MDQKELSRDELEGLARDVRVHIIRMLCEAGSGHPGGSLSLADILTTLYFQVLRHDPKNPDWEDRERFILSKGHGVPTQYACLAKAGYFSEDRLITLRKRGSALQGHPDRMRLPGIEASTGSLGQGLSVAQGIALAMRLNKKDHMTYCVLGDGELQEGQVWEAAMSIPMLKLGHLCAVVDANGCQIDGNVSDVMNIEPLGAKFESFGWQVVEIDGHDVCAIRDAFFQAKSAASGGKPTMIIARTTKGKGVSFMEGKVGWHGVTPSREEADRAIKELMAGGQ